MRKSKINKMKLASVLLLSTVLIPNIAYADEEIDENMEAETAVDPAEMEDTEQTTTETESPDVNNNNDIETNTENAEEAAADNSGEVLESGNTGGTAAPILEPAEPSESPEGNIEETPAEDSLETPEEVSDETNGNTDESEAEISAAEEETPADGSENNEADLDNSIPENREDNVQQEIPEEEPEMPVLPTEPIAPLEPTEPETPAEPNGETTETVPEQEEESPVVEQPSEEPAEDILNTLPGETETNTEASAEVTVEQDPSTIGTAPKKLYRYDYGDILNGISFSEENIHDDLTTLDQRVTRVMSSKIIEEKDLTKEQKLELEEKVKADSTNSYDGETLPNTGEGESTNYIAAGLLSVLGAALLFKSKKLNTDN